MHARVCGCTSLCVWIGTDVTLINLHFQRKITNDHMHKRYLVGHKDGDASPDANGGHSIVLETCQLIVNLHAK